jgi:hypothetical protein
MGYNGHQYWAEGVGGASADSGSYQPIVSACVSAGWWWVFCLLYTWSMIRRFPGRGAGVCVLCWGAVLGCNAWAWVHGGGRACAGVRWVRGMQCAGVGVAVVCCMPGAGRANMGGVVQDIYTITSLWLRACAGQRF